VARAHPDKSRPRGLAPQVPVPSGALSSGAAVTQRFTGVRHLAVPDPSGGRGVGES